MNNSLIPPVDTKMILPASSRVTGKGIAGLDLSRTNKPGADEVLQQFQGILLGEMMKAMRETVPESGLLGGTGSGREMFQSLLDQEYVGALAKQTGGLGLTEALKRQLGLAAPATPKGSELPPVAMPPAAIRLAE